MKNASLILEDGTEYHGSHFGAPVSLSGEIVFNTAMTGYTESITDPSYYGQLLMFTYPLIGNYGVPAVTPKKNFYAGFESEKIHIQGLIVSNYTTNPYHCHMAYTLSELLKKNSVPGLSGIDTRALTKKLRRKGPFLGKIIFNKDIPFWYTNTENLAHKVCVQETMIYGDGKYRILLIDLGVKNNILRCFLQRNCTIVRVPWDYDFRGEYYDGLVISNGPGHPEIYQKTISYLRHALNEDRPILGVCLGHQLLGLASGCKIYKLSQGHRGHNQPVLLEGGLKTYITAQNHSYVIDTTTIPSCWKLLFRNMNDNSCEGLIHKCKPFFSTQFHPEASGGPLDTEFLFDRFISSFDKHKLLIE